MPLALFFILHAFDVSLLWSFQCTFQGTKVDMRPKAPSQTETVSTGLKYQACLSMTASAYNPNTCETEAEDGPKSEATLVYLLGF